MSGHSETTIHPLGDLKYEGAPDFSAVRRKWTPYLYVLLCAGLVALVVLIEVYAKDEPSWMNPILWTWFPIYQLIEVHRAKKARYRIRASGLEWAMPGFAGEERVSAPWESIAWLGRKPSTREGERQLDQAYRLTPGRVRSIPAWAVPDAPCWRVVYQGRSLYHAVDFYPTTEYIRELRTAAPIDAGWRSSTVDQAP